MSYNELMLKKLITIFLIVTSLMMLTISPAQADMAPHNLVGYCISNPSSYWCDFDAIISDILFNFLFFGSIYLFYFAINYTAEYIVGLRMNLSKRPHWALAVFQMNLTTHLALAITNWLTSFFYASRPIQYISIITMGVLGWIIEALILQRWCRLHQTKKLLAITFAKALKLSLIINLTSFLTVALVIGAMVLYMTSSYSSSNSWFPIFAAILSLIGIWIILLLRQKRQSKILPPRS